MSGVAAIHPVNQLTAARLDELAALLQTPGATAFQSRTTPLAADPPHNARASALHRALLEYGAGTSARQDIVIYCDGGKTDGQWTVITAMTGPHRGERIVRGYGERSAA